MTSVEDRTRELAELIESYEPNITMRAGRVASNELRLFSLSETRAILDQLRPRGTWSANSEPCSPTFNVYRGIPVWMRLIFWSLVATGQSLLLPLQFGVVTIFIWRRRWQAIWKEIPSPTLELLDWGNALLKFVNAPMHMVHESVTQIKALCVNRQGNFELKTDGYAVLSNVWGETHGWATPTSWGPVELPLRKKGIVYDHFLKFFDRCEAEWLWVDVLAMPEVYEDMTSSEKVEREALKTSIINTLNKVYTRADKVVILDSLLLRLSSGSLIDAAAVLSLGRWITRLWCFTEVKLAKRVLLKTADSAFDMDSLLDLLYTFAVHEEHRYFPLLRRFAPLRPVPAGHFPLFGSPLDDDSRETHPLFEMYFGCLNRYTDVEIDQARALFPLLDLQWVNGWTLQDGLEHIASIFPEQNDVIKHYCEYRGIEVVRSVVLI